KFNTDLDEIFDYFETLTLVDIEEMLPVVCPIFAINLWNIVNQTDERLPRTNNNVEGWHRRFSSQVAFAIQFYG
ncbi:Uncharacterized protein FKW44_019871, partial [Caligus rogercresseyi]